MTPTTNILGTRFIWSTTGSPGRAARPRASTKSLPPLFASVRIQIRAGGSWLQTISHGRHRLFTPTSDSFLIGTCQFHGRTLLTHSTSSWRASPLPPFAQLCRRGLSDISFQPLHRRHSISAYCKLDCKYIIFRRKKLLHFSWLERPEWILVDRWMKLWILD